MPRVETKTADELEVGDMINIHPQGDKDWREILGIADESATNNEDLIDVYVEGIKWPLSILVDLEVQVNVIHPDE